MPPNRKIQLRNGFTLIEVMITVLVLSIGILGVAGMQSVGIKESQNAYFRTQASILANDIIERLYANRDESHAETGNVYESTGSSLGSCNNTCSAAELAAFDLVEWREAIINSRLPSGVGRVSRLNSVVNDDGDIVGAIYRIEIFWDEDRDGQLANNCDMAASDGCIRVVVHV